MNKKCSICGAEIEHNPEEREICVECEMRQDKIAEEEYWEQKMNEHYYAERQV